MKKILSAVILFLAATSLLDAKEISGRVHHNKKGIANVVVSDGKNFTLTDKDGNFTINTHKDARHVFIVTPSGYVTSCDSGTPHFYRGVDEKDFNFELFRWGIPGGRYTLFAVADPQGGFQGLGDGLQRHGGQVAALAGHLLRDKGHMDKPGPHAGVPGGGMEHAVSAAIRKSGRNIPCMVTVIGRNGQILRSEALNVEPAPLLRTL